MTQNAPNSAHIVWEGLVTSGCSLDDVQELWITLAWVDGHSRALEQRVAMWNNDIGINMDQCTREFNQQMRS